MSDVFRVMLTLAAFALLAARPALADLQVRMPTVEYRELEFEHNGLITFDTKGSPLHNAQSYTNSIGYGVLPWWQIELEGEMASGGGQHLTWNAATLENTFQLTEPGRILLQPRFLRGILAVHPARRAERRHLRTDRPEGAERRVRPRHAAHAQPVPLARRWP